MKTWNEEQITNLARRTYERMLATTILNDDPTQAYRIAFREGVIAVLKDALSISWTEAERRLLKEHENVKNPKS